MNAKQLFEAGEKLFSKRTQLLSLWQEVATHFYPERADFTMRRVIGTEFASNLMTSYPLSVRRDLGNALGTMLRPTAKNWFHMRSADDSRADIDARRWMEHAEDVMRRAMYDRITGFVRATKEGDHDFAAFGQCVISVETNRDHTALLYRNWHLRDVAWCENEEGKIGQVYRRWKPTARDLVRLFGTGRLHQTIVRAAEKDPMTEFEIYHMVVESDLYDANHKEKYVSIYYDGTHASEIECVGIDHQMYVIPRWETVSQSQYAYSPATVAALPEARVMQAMAATLLEAGEKYTNPPMIATSEAIRSDVNIYPGGITWVDQNYDERMGEALRPLTQDKSGMPIGVEMQRDSRALLQEAFYLNKLTMPQRGAAEMTAFEVGQRVQEYIRQALPIFEPMEFEYNGAVCEATFALLMKNHVFGSPGDIPASLKGAEIVFRFESPLHDMIESEKEHKFMEVNAMVAAAIAHDQSIGVVVDFKTALREALQGNGTPASWSRTEREIAAAEAAQAKAAQVTQGLAAMQQGADVAKTIGEASQNLGQGPSMGAAANAARGIRGP